VGRAVLVGKPAHEQSCVTGTGNDQVMSSDCSWGLKLLTSSQSKLSALREAAPEFVGGFDERLSPIPSGAVDDSVMPSV